MRRLPMLIAAMVFVITSVLVPVVRVRADEAFEECKEVYHPTTDSGGEKVGSVSQPLCKHQWAFEVWPSILKPSLGLAGLSHLWWDGLGVTRVIDKETITANPNATNWDWFNGSVKNYAVGATVSWRTTPTGSDTCGFIVNSYDSNQFQLIQVLPQSGKINFYAYSANKWTQLGEVNSAVPIRSGSKMYAAQFADHYYFFINNQLAASFRSTWRANLNGKVGLFSQSGANRFNCDFKEAWVFSFSRYDGTLR